MIAHGKRLAAVLIGVVVFALVLPASSALGPSGSMAGAPASATPALAATLSGGASSPASGSAAGSAVLSTLHADHAPMNEVFLPNFNARERVANGVVAPLYTTAPAPMGLGDFGIQDQDGQNVGTISYTSSVKASVTFGSLEPLYVGAAGPDQFTIQANTVLTDVTVLNTTGNQYWIQNVPVYYADSQTLVFEDNIWNFSNPSFYFPPNGIYAHGPGGFFIGDEVYIGVGSVAYTLAPPFTVTTYNNATILNDRPAVFFNYTVSKGGVSISGSYDFAEFNSTGGAVPTGPAASPTYQINGQAANPTGFLLNDAEIMIGGPGGGSTTNFLGISGSVGLWTQPNGTDQYVSVPSAYDFGTDTGETSAGIAEYSTGGANPTAVLTSGPSLLYPLWGVAGSVAPGAATYSFSVKPSNAFVFAAPGGSFNDSLAAWAPVPTSGTATYDLPPGTYSFQFLLSDYSPQGATYGASGTGHHASPVPVDLRFDPWAGVYTPLWAFDNAQLAAISFSGRGSERSPYVLFNNEYGAIDPLFGEFNDYEFPVFAGIFLVDTSAYVSVVDAPSFLIHYAIAPEASEAAAVGVPSTNFLEENFYGVSHVSIVGASDLTGWLYADDAGFTLASVVFWNSSDNLIAGNEFRVMSQGLILFGGTNNVVWGNTFTPVTLPSPYSNAIAYNGSTFAFELWESGDLIYNNAFLTPITAYTPTVNIYNGAPELSVDTWNVSYRSARDVLSVNGWGLSGNILGLNYEGGNYRWNYGTPSDPTGVLPYNNGGLITVGGDYLPLEPAVHHHH